MGSSRLCVAPLGFAAAIASAGFAGEVGAPPRPLERGVLAEDFVVDVDYRKARVRFLDPNVRPVSEETAEPGEVMLPIRLSDRRPAVEIHLGTGSAVPHGDGD